MDQTIKELWVAELRSGTFEQGKGFLSREGKYCCLGVLCELAVEYGAEVTVSPYRSRDDVKAYDRQAHTLPQSVMEWSGLQEHNPFLVLLFLADDTSLATLNDAGFTFDQIADVIEYAL